MLQPRRNRQIMNTKTAAYIIAFLSSTPLFMSAHWSDYLSPFQQAVVMKQNQPVEQNAQTPSVQQKIEQKKIEQDPKASIPQFVPFTDRVPAVEMPEEPTRVFQQEVTPPPLLDAKDTTSSVFTTPTFEIPQFKTDEFEKLHDGLQNSNDLQPTNLLSKTDYAPHELDLSGVPTTTIQQSEAPEGWITWISHNKLKTGGVFVAGLLVSFYACNGKQP